MSDATGDAQIQQLQEQVAQLQSENKTPQPQSLQ